MLKQSPFPGMDPYLEAHWPDVHTRLLNRVSDQIAEQLPDDLIVSIEESITLGEESPGKRGDVDVSSWGDTTNWDEDWHPVYENYQSPDGSDNIAVPVMLQEEEIPHRHLEVRSARSGREVITVIEALSPSNKSGTSGQLYDQKRASYLRAKMNFVEIDLLRQGYSFVQFPEHWDAQPPYIVFVKRFGKSPEIYGIDYRESLPQFLIPLRPKDQPVTLDLQSALDDCYKAGQYWKRIDYHSDKLIPVPAGEMAEWVSGIVESSG